MRVLSVAALLLLSATNAVAQGACNPRDFLDVDFSRQDQLTRLILLSSMNETQYKKAHTAAKGEMVIPYINVPASGSYGKTKEMLTQVSRLLEVDFTENFASSVLHVGLTAIGVEGYKACVRAQRVVIDMGDNSPTDREFFVYAHWYPEHGEVGKFRQAPEVIGGTFATPVQRNATIRAGDSYRFRIKRDEGGPPLEFAMDFDGNVGKLLLPRIPTKTLLIEGATFPAVGTPPLSINSDNSNGHGYHRKEACYDAPSDREFVIGSAVPIEEVLVRREWGAKVEVTHQDERRLCLRVATNAPTKGVGGFTAGRASVRTVRVVDADPAKLMQLQQFIQQ